MLMLFEDKDTMPISLMFKKIYGENVDFSSGAKKLQTKINKHISEDKIFCFVDVVAGNPNTLKSLICLLDDNYYNKNVQIVPIPCIEYYALLTLNSFGYLSDDYLSTLKYIKVGIGKKVDITTSFEKYFKSLLNSDKALKCQHNGQWQNGEYGYWYSNNCDCDYRDTCLKYLYEQKLVRMLSFMPVAIANKTINVLIDVYSGDITRDMPDVRDKFTPLYKRMLQCIYDKEVK